MVRPGEDSTCQGFYQSAHGPTDEPLFMSFLRLAVVTIRICSFMKPASALWLVLPRALPDRLAYRSAYR